MNWAQNKFLIGLGAVTLIGAGALGFFVVKAKSQFDALSETYQAKAAAYDNLRKQPLALTEENLTKLEGQTDVVAQTAVALQEKLASHSFPLEAATPEQFQDRLRTAVSEVLQKAQVAKVTLPDGFYLGFNQYQNQPPRTEAAAPLLRQLKTVQLATEILIDARVTSIAAVTRTPLPEEGAAAATPRPAPAPKKKAAAPAKPAPAAKLVVKYPFDIQFIGEQGSIRKAFNDLAKNDKQFLIIRPLNIQNEQDKSTPRQVAAQTAAALPTPEATPAEQAAPLPTQGAGNAASRQLQYIVGTEKINVLLRVEMTVFDNPFPHQ
ncbi:MAG TPA: Amuc_1100 family pilus-like protein [Chthoniobacteraceae bacterium]|nr:Amuc_1100 family pilus-like protein [Chthoniobacteraceae bacterium]